ncbi:Fe-S-cluster formation regulator IscX/YfhJ [Catalinimonas alkaloidigena]|uniref:hypothetical protein n=1 Tax=Catalinimonas alkaloidigena TaxID=1075417 RepID=UPI0024056439|nr:hypothetical protein [Catalinimonas alkaloidigena]MDF9798770.1 Fe-S-cluster formation regulator IscX/YfhJ [Catalinimonas alkaloidigena]
MRLLLSLVLITNCAMGQNTPMHFDDENFAYQVKQVDEFIERFNNTNETLIKSYLKDRYNLEVSREELVASLFDFSKKDWNKQQIEQFLEDVVYQTDPPYISFYDQGWYAKVVCKGRYDRKNVYFSLIMSVKHDLDNETVNWVINSIDADFLRIHGEVTNDMILPPNSHGTDFLELKRIFNSPELYIDRSRSNENPVNKLLQSVRQGKLQYMHVDNVSYHFMQLDNWIFKVEEFDRQEKNNGWLISELYTADQAEKDRYLSSQLYILPH